MISAQDLIERITSAATCDDCIVILTETSQANLRWANSTLTTNGVILQRSITVIAFVAVDGGMSAGAVTRTDISADQIDAVLKEAIASARSAGAADDAAEIAKNVSFGNWSDAHNATGPDVFSKVAPDLGDMFKRSDYPTANEMVTKFAFRIGFLPVPTAGDFRVDIGNEAQAELKAKLEALAEERVESAMRDIRMRLKEHLKRMSDRLTTDYVQGEAKQRRFHDSLVDGALELCDLTKALNVIGDPALEGARKELEQALLGVTPQELRKNEHTRQDTKKAVDDILSKFSF